MKTAPLFITGVLAVLLAGPVTAQTTQSAPTPAPAMPDASAPAAANPGAPVNPSAAGAPAASDAATPTSAVAQDPSAPMGSTANPIPQSSPTPTDQASSLTAGDPSVVSNGPVPDTKANRAKYGQPLSATGRSTKPAGN
jgi:hypothetical protein